MNTSVSSLPTLYLSPQPTRSARARWAFHEAGAAFEEVCVDLFKGEHKQPAYLEVNPLGLLPAARIDDEIMIESSALALWVAMDNPAQGLVPDAPEAMRACLQWVIHAPAELDPQLATLNQHTRLLPPDQRDAGIVAAAAQSLSAKLERLSDAMKAREWIAGDKFSIADVVVGHALVWAHMIEQLDAHPILLAYLQRLEAREAFVKSYGGPIQTFPDPHG